MPQLRSLLKPIFDHPALRDALEAVSAGGRGAVLSGVTRTAKGLIAAGLASKLRRPVVILTSDNETAEGLRQTAVAFLGWLGSEAGGALSVLPAFDCSPYEGRSPHPEILEQRAVALWNLARGQVRVLFVPLAAALGRFREAPYYRSLAVELKIGDELSLSDLGEHLLGVGYEPAEPVLAAGQFSVRGGIVDVFPPESGQPLRIEFFGDCVESIREFDPGTQRSRQPTPTALLLPLWETKRSTKLFEALVEALSKRPPARHSPKPDWAAACSAPFPGWEFYVPLAEPHRESLITLLEKPVLVWDEPLERSQQLKHVLETWAAGFDEFRDALPPRPRPDEIFLTEEEFWKSVQDTPHLSLKELGIESEEAGADRLAKSSDALPAEFPEPDGGRPGTPRNFVVLTQPPPKFHGAVKSLIEDLTQRRERQETVIYALPTVGKLDRMREILKEYEMPFESVADAASIGDAGMPGDAGSLRPPPAESIGEPPHTGTGIWLAQGELAEGVVFPDLRLALMRDSDLLG
ncbi:MAG: hypothetical protein HYS33_07010, partial [Acidobacteria bacterium]|nr:hypothetical protein [Acidobacteriota bacterium]